MATDPPIAIRSPETPAEYAALQEAQRLAWGLADDSYVVPLATMVGARHHGGLVLGAFLPDGRAVGFSFAFLGRVGPRWCLYSQLTGIIPGHQGSGIGGRIKAIQRDYARELGLDFVAWSFDPLQAGNARFNLRKLGATSGRYFEDMYGPRTDALNKGVPTDRLIAEWPVIPGALPDPTGTSDHRLVTTAPRLVDDSRSIPLASGTEAEVLLIEIPAEIARLRSEAPEQAEAWRSAVARGFGEAFAAGYRAEDVVRDGGRSFYVLRRPGP